MRALSASFLILWTAAAILRITALDETYRERARIRSEQQDVLSSPGSNVLRATSLEHPLAWADLTWLSIVQEIGGQRDEMAWDRVERWCDIATDLDPLYFTIYHSVAVNLSVWAKRPAASDRVLLKGWHFYPNRWELPFLVGYNAYFLRSDFQLASDYLRQAAELEGAPRFLAALAGRMRFQGGDEEGAIALLEAMIGTLDGPAREAAEERLLMLKSEPRLRKYDDACRNWRAQHGQPATAQQLFEQRAVDEEPLDLLGYAIQIDADCISRTEMIRVREFEAVKQRAAERGKDGVEITADDPEEGGTR